MGKNNLEGVAILNVDQLARERGITDQKQLLEAASEITWSNYLNGVDTLVCRDYSDPENDEIEVIPLWLPKKR